MRESTRRNPGKLDRVFLWTYAHRDGFASLTQGMGSGRHFKRCRAPHSHIDFTSPARACALNTHQGLGRRRSTVLTTRAAAAHMLVLKSIAV